MVGLAIAVIACVSDKSSMSNHEHWSKLTDANGQLYDPRPALKAAEGGHAEAAYAELWDRLHHQGDLGTAAYAAVPELAGQIGRASIPDWRAYALIATVEEQRHRAGNPAVPQWLDDSYRTAIGGLIEPALGHLRTAEGDEEVRSILAVLAHAKGQRSIGAIALWAEDERLEALGDS